MNPVFTTVSPSGTVSIATDLPPGTKVAVRASINRVETVTSEPAPTPAPPADPAPTPADPAPVQE